MRLILVIFSMQVGGAERVMSIMANYWAAKNLDITVITFEDGTQTPFYELDSRINRVPLELAGASRKLFTGVKNNLLRLWRLRQTIVKARPHAVISFMPETNVLTLLATRGLRVPVLIAEHSDPENVPIGPIWARLRLWTYPWARKIVVLNKRARTFFRPRLRSLTTIIPNPVVIHHGDIGEAKKPASGRLVMAMGRLSWEKRFDLLLHAFARISDKHQNWTLMILGDGPLRSDIVSLQQELDLGGRIQLPGAVKCPHALLKQADLFVVSSQLEGFPMALCEAMACGVPVISTEYHSGVREIIEDGVNGVLVPPGNVDPLAKEMDRLMSDDTERRRLASRAPDVVGRFSLDKVMGMWEQLLEEAVQAG